MLALLVIAAAFPSLVVVHDGALDAATVATTHLQARGVDVVLRREPLTNSCVHSQQCASRPAGELLLVMRDARTVRLDLVDAFGKDLIDQSVAVDDNAALAAAVVPALDRIADHYGAHVIDPLGTAPPLPIAVAPPDPAAETPSSTTAPPTAPTTAPPTAPPTAPLATTAPLTGEDADAKAAAKVKEAQDQGFPTWVLPALAVAGLVVFAGAVVAIEARTPEGRQDISNAGASCCGSLCDAVLQSLVDACCQASVDVLCAALCNNGGGLVGANQGGGGAAPYESPPPGLGTGRAGMPY